MPLNLLILFSVVLMIVVPYSALSGEEQEKPLYHDLAPSIIVNLKTGAKYARCDIQLMTRGEEHLEKIELHAAALRNEFLFLIPEFDGKELQTTEGKEKLRSEALLASQGLMLELSGDDIIEALYFTSFLVQ